MDIVYSECVQLQLDMLDENIERIYNEEMSNICNDFEDIDMKKARVRVRIQPFLDEKVRLIWNSCPKYMLNASEVDVLKSRGNKDGH